MCIQNLATGSNNYVAGQIMSSGMSVAASRRRGSVAISIRCEYSPADCHPWKADTLFMDRSPEFIAMCRLSREIQQSWRPAHGDFFLGENGRIECWLSKFAGRRRVRKGFGVRRRQRVIHLAPYHWLPRLDQLMELAQVPSRRFEQTTQVFFDWARAPYRPRPQVPGHYLKTLEQLWLAFVMQQKYNQFWDGSGWVRG